MPPVSHLYFLGFFFWLCYCISRNWGWVHSTGKRFFCSGILTTEQETGLAKCEHKLPVNTLIKWFGKKKKCLRSVLCIGKHIKFMEITCLKKRSLNKNSLLLKTLHCWSSWGCSLGICGIVWLRLQSRKAKQMLATAQNCICGGQSLIERRPWCRVWQKRVQLFILFLRRTLPSQQSKAVQKTQVYQHLGGKNMEVVE